MVIFPFLALIFSIFSKIDADRVTLLQDCQELIDKEVGFGSPRVLSAATFRQDIYS